MYTSLKNLRRIYHKCGSFRAFVVMSELQSTAWLTDGFSKDKERKSLLLFGPAGLTYPCQ